MKLAEVNAAICDQLKISEIKPNKNGKYIYLFDDVLEIELGQSSNGDIILQGLVADLSKRSLEEKDIEVLLRWAASLITTDNNNDVLSFDSKTNRIILFRKLSRKTINLKNILESLEGIINNIEIWITALDEKSGKSLPPNPQSLFIKP